MPMRRFHEGALNAPGLLQGLRLAAPYVLGLGLHWRRAVGVLITRATRTGGAYRGDEHRATHPQPLPSFHCFTSYRMVSSWSRAAPMVRGAISTNIDRRSVSLNRAVTLA